MNSKEKPLKILAVTAHPDDEIYFAATIYKITHHLQGIVDLLLFTDGAGGYRWSSLAEKIYGFDLTNENAAKKNLPGIRKVELINGGKIIGIRNYFYLDQPDDKDVRCLEDVLTDLWDVSLIKTRIKEILISNEYDFIFVMLPYEETHGHHQASSLIMLEVCNELDTKPIILGAKPSDSSEGSEWTYHGLKNYELTRPKPNTPVFSFDRNQPLGYLGKLNYNIIVNWVIAEHKTQGTYQKAMNRWDLENFWVFQTNSDSSTKKIEELFISLQN